MNKEYKPYSYKMAALLAVIVSILLNFLLLLAFMFKGKASEPRPDGIQLIAPYNFIIAHLISNFCTAFILYVISFKIFRKHYPACRRIMLTIIFSILATIITSYLFSIIQHSFIVHTPTTGRYIFGNMMRDFFIMIIVLFSASLIYLSVQRQQTLLENQKLLSENIRSRYEVLKNQVDPHFLFNALNTLHSLIITDTGKAQEYVVQLSSIFRYSIQNKEIVTLREELDFTNAYCHLVKIRYGENLLFDFRIEEKYFSYYIMPFSLQILLENAIKHNVISNKQPFVISIVSSHETDTLEVSNPIQIRKDTDNTAREKIGLANLTERYRIVTQKQVIINQENNIFKVSIPLFLENL